MIKENERTNEEQNERPCCRIRLQFTKYTVWPLYDQNGRFFDQSECNKIRIHKISSKANLLYLFIGVGIFK